MIAEGANRVNHGKGVGVEVLIVRIWAFVFREIGASLNHEPLRIDEPAAGTRLRVRQSFFFQRIHDKIRDSGFRLASAEEDESLIDSADAL